MDDGKDWNERTVAETLDTITTCQTLDNDIMMQAYTSELIIRPTAPTKLKLQNYDHKLMSLHQFVLIMI